MSARLTKAEHFATLPPDWPHDVRPQIRAAAAARGHTLVVLDDDPTGTQTVHDIPVVTRWDVATLSAELARAEACFYILTNSRSLTDPAARELILEIARNLQAASVKSGRSFTIVSRSDSTLRGHFPVETTVLAEILGPFDATLLVPYFEAGGRYTIADTHYVAEGEALIPAAETPFAQDPVFGYRASDLRAWVEEKMPGAKVRAITHEQLRTGGPEVVATALRALPRGCVCFVNACSPRDADVFAAATLLAERAGTRLLYRTAASFVAARLGLESRALLSAREIVADTASGGLLVVGSHVPKTTVQLARLLALQSLYAVDLDVPALLDDARHADTVKAAARDVDSALERGRDVVLYTSRLYVTGGDDATTLGIGHRVSAALVEILGLIKVSPRWLIAKGGITSSDTATEALHVRRAMVLGQLIPGVPVWRLGEEARFPGLGYVVFPGNVGGPEALTDAVRILSQP